jgi:hypothetical protein
MTTPTPYFPVQRIARRAAPIEKIINDRRTPWAVPVDYVLADGRVIPTVERFRRKRDAHAFAATLPAVPDVPTAVALNPDETICMKQHTYRIGG